MIGPWERWQRRRRKRAWSEFNDRHAWMIARGYTPLVVQTPKGARLRYVKDE